MNPQDVIRGKRDGETLSKEQISGFVSGVCAGAWSPGQTGSMLMAIFQKGLNLEETRFLLESMLRSGEVLDLSGVAPPICDKHSTGGVGDKVSLVLAPLAAACGMSVPMLSGRGLGHTGGTLDKLESIPGFRVFLTAREIRRQVREVGCVIAGQTEKLVPADKILYAMRDETSTVEHPSLIAASILSKKLAEGLDCLLLDVKCGRGAFCSTEEEAERLARLMVDLGKAAGCRTAAWLTRMDAPLGRNIGNALEVEECISILKGESSGELCDLICAEVAGMLQLAERANNFGEALQSVRGKISSGAALQKFKEMIDFQEGDPSIIDDPSLLPRARHITEIVYEEPETRWVCDVDARKIAEVVLQTGAGRRNAGDSVDHSTGISSLVGCGERLEPGDLVCRLHHSSKKEEERWVNRIREAITLSPERSEPAPRIFKRIE